ncbi:MAG: hypothetical protein U0165_00630 [Polyangiaceae bacterium]
MKLHQRELLLLSILAVLALIASISGLRSRIFKPLWICFQVSGKSTKRTETVNKMIDAPQLLVNGSW